MTRRYYGGDPVLVEQRKNHQKLANQNKRPSSAERVERSRQVLGKAMRALLLKKRIPKVAEVERAKKAAKNARIAELKAQLEAVKKRKEEARISLEKGLKLAKDLSAQIKQQQEAQDKEKAEEDAEKAAKAKMSPVPPPKLDLVQDKLNSLEFRYLKHVLRNLSKDKPNREDIDGKIYMYYPLKTVIDTLNVQMGALIKHKKADGYSFSDDKSRDRVLVQLNNYIKYFNYKSFRNKVDLSLINGLFDGIED
jgi:hypothetical protein